MAASEKFCLRWNDFESNISGAFRELREDKDFFDITIACDDDQLDAHKVILSACSPFFRALLKRNKHEHPLVYLKGVRYSDLLSVLNFMYHGEVNVAQEELNSFLSVAEDLKVKGLTQSNSSSSSKSSSNYQPRKQTPPPPAPAPKKIYNPPPAPAPAKTFSAPHYQQSTSVVGYQSDDDIQEVVQEIKSEPVSQPIQPPPPQPAPAPAPLPTYHQPAPVVHHQQQANELALSQADTHALTAADDYADYEGYDTGMNSGYDDSMQMTGGEDANKDLDAMISQSIFRYEDPACGPVWQCTICKKENKNKAQIKRHVESHISGFVHSCSVCMKEFKSRESLRTHSYTHKKIINEFM